MSKKAAKRRPTLEIPAYITAFSRLLEFISPHLAAAFAIKLFTTPLRYKLPKRKLEMDKKSRQKTIRIPKINRDVMVYEYGKGNEKILLVQGWSGRGTQLVKFADEFVKAGYSTISFDAPAHGKSEGKQTLMPEFIATILQLEKEFGPFKAAVGHSLGGMSLLNAVRQGLKVNRMVIIGSGDIIKDIVDDFVAKLKLKPGIGNLMTAHFEKTSGQTMAEYSAYVAAQHVGIPVLVVHDEKDQEVSINCAHHIVEHLKQGQLLVTKGLGHRKILGNHDVINSTLKFLNIKL
ncbi:MAG TPA: alpha/beta hydrolase [Flavobacterium sp.]|jgi:pimeloyl-ACP methyl ester carboxylesterase